MKEYINPDVIVNIYNQVDDSVKRIIEDELSCSGYDINEILNEYEKEYY